MIRSIHWLGGGCCDDGAWKHKEEETAVRGRAASAGSIRRAERMAQALEYRTNGFTFEQNRGDVGLYTLRCLQLVQKGIARTIEEPAQELRALQLERLDEMLTAVYSHACQGDIAAITRTLDILDRMNKLTGLDRSNDVKRTRVTTDSRITIVDEKLRRFSGAPDMPAK
jgi:hypothetical protein